MALTVNDWQLLAAKAMPYLPTWLERQGFMRRVRTGADPQPIDELEDFRWDYVENLLQQASRDSALYGRIRRHQRRLEDRREDSSINTFEYDRIDRILIDFEVRQGDRFMLCFYMGRNLSTAFRRLLQPAHLLRLLRGLFVRQFSQSISEMILEFVLPPFEGPQREGTSNFREPAL